MQITKLSTSIYDAERHAYSYVFVIHAIVYQTLKNRNLVGILVAFKIITEVLRSLKTRSFLAPRKKTLLIFVCPSDLGHNLVNLLLSQIDQVS